MSVIRPKPPEDPIRFAAALVAAGAGAWPSVDRLEAARNEAVSHPCAAVPERLLAAYGTRRPESELFAILRTARRIREAVDRVIVIGSDRFVAGTRAIVDACCHPFHNELCRGERGGRPRLSCEGFGIDNDATQGLLDLVAPHGRPRGDDLLDRWALVVVGGDEPPRSVAAVIRLFAAALGEAVGGDVQRLADRVVPIAGWPAEFAGATDLAEGFAIPAGLDGPQAVLTAVGLLPASIVGVDVVRLLEGAAAMTRRFRESPVGDNPVLQCAAAAHHGGHACAATGRLSIPSRQLRAVGVWHDLLRASSLSAAGQGSDHGSPVARLLVGACRRDRLRLPAAGPLAGGVDPLAGLVGTAWSDLPAAVAAEHDPARRDEATATIDLPRIDEHAVGQLLQMLLLAAVVEERLARP